MCNRINYTRRRAERGFTAIEFVVAVTLFTIVMGAVYGLMKVASSDRFTTNQRTEVLQNLRVAMNAIGRDALNAGYNYNRSGGNLPDDALNSLFGIPADKDTVPDILRGVCSGRGVNTNSLNPDTVAANRVTDQVTFVYKSDFVDPLPISTVAANVLTVDTTNGKNNSGIVINGLYLIEGTSSQAIGMATSLSGTNQINFASGTPTPDTLNINRTSTGGNVIKGVTGAANLTKIRIVTFRVLNDGTLVRTEYGSDGGGSWQDQPLAYGVEKMNITYVLADGTESTDPAEGPDKISGTADDTPAKLGDVRQVRVTITARSAEMDPRMKDYFRVTLSGTFNTRNMGYSRAT